MRRLRDRGVEPVRAAATKLLAEVLDEEGEQ